jgi:hypothetical protein
MNEDDGTQAPIPKRKRSSRNKSAKLKLSGWYESAARSIRINDKPTPEKPDEESESRQSEGRFS